MEAKDVKTLMEAYASVYTTSEEATDLQESVETVEEGLATTVDKVTRTLQGGLEKMGVKINRTPRGTTTKADQEAKIKKEDVDLFDIIKGHLIDEGFAETEEAAVAIMANMSEGWKESIVEGKQSK
jgi:hypothetical protein